MHALKGPRRHRWSEVGGGEWVGNASISTAHLKKKKAKDDKTCNNWENVKGGENRADSVARRTGNRSAPVGAYFKTSPV